MKDSCNVCGFVGEGFKYQEILGKKLIKEWCLEKGEVERRNKKESGRCPKCNCSVRSRGIARAVIKHYKFKGNFMEWVGWADMEGLRVAEINYCGDLHPILKGVRNLVLSQYGEETIRARLFNKLKGIKREDVTDLSYKDYSFDLVLHSEVLEHVDDPIRGLRECQRVLKKEGVCIFTIPVIPTRETKRRATIRKGEVINLEEPSYHGSGERGNLVYWEYGGDFVKRNNLEVAYKDESSSLWVFKIDNETVLDGD